MTTFDTTAFDNFLIGFFAIFTNVQFRGTDFLRYLERPAARRGGDEASIVDAAIVIPLLGLLGWGPGQQTYNQGKKFGRPDFAPNTPEFGDCFVVEDKSTGLELTLDVTDAESHLAQLGLYLRSLGLRAGWLTNGARLMVWRFDDPLNPVCALDFDVANAVRQSVGSGINGLSAETKNALRYLWEQFQWETFADLTRLEREIASDEAEWLLQALPLGANAANQELLMGAVKGLLQDLQADARRRLDSHLDAADKHHKRRMRLREDDTEAVPERLQSLRVRIEAALTRLAPTIGLETAEIRVIEDDLRELEREPRAFINWKALSQSVLDRLNAARERKHLDSRQRGKPWTKFDNGLSDLGEALQSYGEIAFLWHQHQAVLRHDNRVALETTDNYGLWISLVQETMLGGLDEEQKRNEFALQAVYVVFIRLLLLRVCEDKGILWNRILSDGGLKHWQASIERYYQFATGNPYEPLLDMAYNNAQNIYAHFFTGRELFNWYTLDRSRFVRVLYQLGRFNFADVDSDLIGTIYNTYVERPEKKQKGQYYTPSQIVRYILDETGYRSGAAIIGPNNRLIDPACGSGSFLVEAARRLVAAYKVNNADNPRDLLDRVRENLYGFDLNPFACYLAEVNLLIQVLDLVKLAIENKQPARLERFHIYNVDALAPASGTLYYLRTDTLMAAEMDVVDRLKSRQAEYTGGFRWVVANPPYGASLTDKYQKDLREWYSEVFGGQPDTYVFFFRLGMKLLGANGTLGFITPDTYLMGTNTIALRAKLLEIGRITQIVNLPQGIWTDAVVNCALLFLTADANTDIRRQQQTQVFSMGVRDKLDKLEARDWKETFTQSQSTWIDSQRHEIKVRWTPLLERTEEACRISVNGGTATKILRLGDITESSAGIDPYATAAAGQANLYIKSRQEVPKSEAEWKPVLDTTAFIGRYERRWGRTHPYIKYGNWLCRAREQRFFESAKLITQDMRDRSLYRRLVATYDDEKFYIVKTSTISLRKIRRLTSSIFWRCSIRRCSTIGMRGSMRTFM